MATGELMRVTITGGGTGGHIYPALAVAQALKDDPEISQVTYIGKEGGLEESIIGENGIAFYGIHFSGMPRTLTLRWVTWGLSLLMAVSKSIKYLQQQQPHVVFATGGYVSAPVLLAAKLLRIPYVIHEPDTHAGLVNQLMGKWATHITGAFEVSQAFFPKRPFTHCGNPLRQQLGGLSKAEALKQLGLEWDPAKRVLVVSGGSQGAQTLNRVIVESLPFLVDTLGLQVIHQTGAKHFEAVQAQLASIAFENHSAYLVKPFFKDMGLVLSAGDLSICRAGSMTLSELFVSSLPAILIPYPHSAANHQEKNAQTMVNAGAALMILDHELTSQTLRTALGDILNLPGRLDAMQAASRALARPAATRTIVEHLKMVARMA